MTKVHGDIWSRWLLERRFGGDQAAMQDALSNYLYPWRDQVLSHANLQEGDMLLDVGCGDGLIAFGALEKYVIFASACGARARNSESCLGLFMGNQIRCKTPLHSQSAAQRNRPVDNLLYLK
jgi:hypothetical protein